MCVCVCVCVCFQAEGGVAGPSGEPNQTLEETQRQIRQEAQDGEVS